VLPRYKANIDYRLADADQHNNVCLVFIMMWFSGLGPADVLTNNTKHKDIYIMDLAYWM